MSAPHLVACEHCDLLLPMQPLAEGETASCGRCGSVLRSRVKNGLERALALTVAAAVLFVVANSFPFLSLDKLDLATRTTLMTGILDLWRGGKEELAALVFLTVELAPLAQILLLIWVLVPLRVGRRPPLLPLAFRLLNRAQTWSMLEVFMIGILVAIVKLLAIARVVPGLALWAFVLLILILAGAVAAYDPDEVWERVEGPS